jgi:Flp pilus assembly pilin Flp
LSFDIVMDSSFERGEVRSRRACAVESAGTGGVQVADCIVDMEVGQSLVEYSLLLVLVAVIVLGSIWLVGLEVSRAYGTVNTSIGESEEIPTSVPTATPEEGSSSWQEWREAVGSGWRAETTRYCVDQQGEHRSFYGAENWTDYVVRVKANLYQGQGYGVFFRAVDTTHLSGYVFQYEPTCTYLGREGCFSFRKVVGGTVQYPFARSGAPFDYQWYNADRDIELRVEGSSFRAFIDGEEVLMATDQEYTHGQVGLRAWDGSEVCFWEFTITFLEQPDRDRDDRDGQ